MNLQELEKIIFNYIDNINKITSRIDAIISKLEYQIQSISKNNDSSIEPKKTLTKYSNLKS